MRWTRRVPVAGLAVLLAAGPAWAQAAGEPGGHPEDSESASQSPPQEASGQTSPADRPLAQLLPNLGRDVLRFPSLGTAVILGVGGALSAAAHRSDASLTTHAAAGGTDQVFAVGGIVGNGWVQGGIALGTYTVGRLKKHTATAHLGADLIRAQVLTTVLTAGLKVAVDRTRPPNQDTGYAGTHSFPSGHSASTWTTATVLWRHLGWKTGVPASLVAAYVSASRLQQNQHYMSDVVFGAALGVASGYTVTFGHGSHRVSIAPAPVAGGGAIVLSVTPR
ncbi:MAG: phosphatase PAP2 family protein [Acidobacteriota bacterium]|nr:phosphatase PAP2 family protein [Acidobacteriota bacterium]